MKGDYNSKMMVDRNWKKVHYNLKMANRNLLQVQYKLVLVGHNWIVEVRNLRMVPNVTGTGHRTPEMVRDSWFVVRRNQKKALRKYSLAGGHILI